MLLVAGFLLNLPLRSANAGIFSILGTNSPKNNEVTDVSAPNSQNMRVLEAAVSPDRELGRGNGDITIENGALLPEIGPMGTAADIKSEYFSDQITNYIVREGDTISDLAEMFQISANTIIWQNDLKKGQPLIPGSTLVILPITGVEYAVKKGDTLAGIAKKFNGDKSEISKYNGVTDETVLAIGTILLIPDGEIITSSPNKGATTGNYAGYYMRPISGGVRTQGRHGNNGVDLANSIGTPVKAAAAGRVIVSRDSGWNGGYGDYIVISHPNGTQTLYAHLNETKVAAGERVEQGQTIGTVGNSGKSTGPHLHFEIRNGPRNPF